MLIEWLAEAKSSIKVTIERWVVLLNLFYLKKFVPSSIFKRGESYYHNEQVLHIKQKQNKTKSSTFHAEVMGTELYLVEIEVNDQLDILSSYSDCPYAQKDFCKHQIALCLVVLDSVVAPETSKESKTPFILWLQL